MDQRYASARDMQKALRESYAAMQGAMGAQTMAFSSPDAGSGEQTRMPTQSQQPTEQYSNSQNSPAASDSFSSEKTENIPADDFDEIINDRSGFNGEKTEVIPFDKLPRAENYPSSTMQATPNAVNPSPAPHNDFNQQAAAAPMDSPAGQSPETREAGGAANYNSQPKTEGNYAAAAAANTFSPGPTASQAQSAAFSPSPAIYNQPKKKSGGKGLAVAGGIGALGFVAVGAAAIGWYALKPAESKAVAPTPTPTPQVETVSTPTVKVSGETVTSPITSSTEAVPSTPKNNEDQKASASTEKNNSRKTTTQTVMPTLTKAAPTVRVVTAKTPAPEKTPPPPKVKTPAKSSRTDILQ